MNFISFYFLVLFYLSIHPSINPSSDHLFMHSFIYLYGRSFVQFLLSFSLLFSVVLSSFIFFFLSLFLFLNLLLAFHISKRKQTLFYHCKSYSIGRGLQHFTRLPPSLVSKLSKIMFPPDSGAPSQALQLICARKCVKPREVQGNYLHLLVMKHYIVCQKQLRPFDCTHGNVFFYSSTCQFAGINLSQNMAVRLQFN